MYRNKDEFSINKGIDGDPKTVGFYIRSPIDGEIICVPPTELINIKKKHIEISQVRSCFVYGINNQNLSLRKFPKEVAALPLIWSRVTTSY